MQIEVKPIDSLKAYARNSRTHSAKQVDQLAASLQEFGWTNPVLVDGDGMIVAGHGRVMAARQLGMTQVPTISLARLSDAQRRAYVIADNKLALESGWDTEVLALELADLQGQGFAMDLTGFDAGEMLGITDPKGKRGHTDDDAAPDVPVQPASRLGDVWLLDRHRIMCGDSTAQEQVDLLIAGRLADVLLTDPPYNVDYQGGTKAKLKIGGDKQTDGAFREFLTAAMKTAANALRPGGAFYVWHADSEGYNFRGACQTVGLQVRQCLIWKKQTLVMGRSDYHWKHEPCLYGWKAGGPHSWFGGRKLTTVIDLTDGSPFVRLPDGRWEVSIGARRLVLAADAVVEDFASSVLEFDRPQRNDVHPTMKPVALFEYLMLNNTQHDDVVLDTFGGSGTTLIAAEKHERQARLMELDPKYCDVIVQRWQDFTGKAAVLESTGATFDDIKEHRD